MKRLILLLAVVASTFTIGWYAGSDSMYFKISKSLELFGAVFREISENYVDDIEPEKFVRSGVEGMLETLDPYTELFDQARTEDFDALTTGQYVGFGISVATRDSMLTITGVADGYSARQNGIRIGDRLYAIDSVVTIRLTSKDLRKYTRGEPGSESVVRVLRDGISDTLKFTLQRKKISVNSVTYVGRTSNNVGIIKLDRFSRRSAEEVRIAMDSLRSLGQLTGIILDLRDNPGGLLDAAVSICEIFIPNGSVIVSTKGRGSNESRIYTSNTIPYDATTPLAVLINKNSASASEIVAGCIQDLDRGVVIGENSFGKGLVQSVFPMPYNNSLKITTSKYYTPSGRCIQKIDYTKRRTGQQTTINSSTSESNVFYTLGKRIVKEGNGITPDSIIKERDNPEFVNQLIVNNLLFRFATEYSATKQNIQPNFSAVPLVEELEKYALGKKFAFDNPAMKKFTEIKKILTDEKFNAEVIQQISESERIVKNEQSKLFKLNTKSISSILDEEIRARFLSEKEMTDYTLRNDEVVRKTSFLLGSEQYRSLLRTPHTVSNSTPKQR
jgi:carboxyl-terminal processing protease